MFVADASTSLCWLIPGQRTAVSDRAQKLLAKGPVVVPALWQLETQNAILKLVRQKKLTEEDATEIRTELLLLSKRVDGALDDDGMERVWGIAKGCMMTAYDATYVEIALRYELPLATDDQAIRAAARQLRVKLV